MRLQSGRGSVKVSVKDAAGAAVPGAEVTLLVVEKAILDLMPYELQVRGLLSWTAVQPRVCLR